MPKKQKPLPPRHKRLNRAGRLQAGRLWLARYDGKRVLRGYARHFAVDLGCALKELQMLGVTFPPEYVEALQATLAARKRASHQKPKGSFTDDDPWMPGDEQFAFIAGRTEGGAAYGVTWAEMAELEKPSAVASPGRPMTTPEDDDGEALWDARLAAAEMDLVPDEQTQMSIEDSHAFPEPGRAEQRTPGPAAGDGTRSNVAAAYDAWAATYDADLNKTRDLAAAVLRRCDLNLTGRHVIEAGCGTGRNTVWLAERAASVLGLDLSEGMLRQARAYVNAPHVRFLRHDIRSAWPVADASADIVIAMLVLEHVEHLAPIFAEATRALRLGGELFLCEYHPLRQMLGRQAQFTHPETGEIERVAAFLHDVSDYVNGGLQAGFTLLHLGEWRDADADRAAPPRLLSAHFRRSGRAAS